MGMVGSLLKNGRSIGYFPCNKRQGKLLGENKTGKAVEWWAIGVVPQNWSDKVNKE